MAEPVSTGEIARVMREQRDLGQPLNLILAARTGELYKNTAFYGELEQKIDGFQNLSDTERFKRCLEVLSTYYTDSQIYDLLSRVSATVTCRNVDSQVVDLVQAGFVKTIITTTVGSLLENAFIPAGLKEPQDYQVVVPDRRPKSRRNPKHCHIFKVFGERESRTHKIADRQFTLENDRLLRGFLEAEFQKSVLLAGFDQAWDRQIEPLFLPGGGTLYYINEDAPPASSHLAGILQQRPCKSLIGAQGAYEQFIQDIHQHLIPHVNLASNSASTAPSTLSGSRARGRAFISYAHADSAYLERLVVHLTGYIYHEQDQYTVWSDRDIQDGTRWQTEITQALESSSVAILLVSADFLASKYIREYELPALLQRAKKDQVTLLSFVLSPCSIKGTELIDYQIVNSPDGSFCDLSQGQQALQWEELVQQALNLLRAP